MTPDRSCPEDPPPSARESAAQGAERLKEQWGRRATTGACRYYVASHTGWSDPERWQRQAATDLRNLTYGLDPEWLARVDVLEIGCGVGRLVPGLLPLCASYSGCDVAPAMVAEARRENRSERARFVESDGAGIPAALCDRTYGLVFAWAVWIHCPLQVIDALFDAAVARTAPGGRVRFQVLADLDDPEGVGTMPPPPPPGWFGAEPSAALRPDGAAEAVDDVPAEARSEAADYMGHRFGWREARAFFGRGGGTLHLYRMDPVHLYGDWVADGGEGSRPSG